MGLFMEEKKKERWQEGGGRGLYPRRNLILSAEPWRSSELRTGNLCHRTKSSIFKRLPPIGKFPDQSQVNTKPIRAHSQLLCGFFLKYE